MIKLLSRWVSSGSCLSPIGLDINPRIIRAAQLERRGGRWEILHVARWDQRGSESELTLSDGLARRIRRSVQQWEYRGGRLVAGLSTPEVELHALEIPDRGELRAADKFAEAVRWELERVKGLAEADVRIGHWRVPASKGTRTTAIGVVSPAPHVAFGSALAGAIRCECQCVDATACALSRLGWFIRRGSEPSTSTPANSASPKTIWGVLDLGERQSRMVVCVDDLPVLVRTLGEGGGSWTERVAESLNLSSEAAELHKVDYGIGEESNPDDTSTQSETAVEIGEMILKALKTDLELLAGEIERSYEYVLRCYPDGQAASLLLVGGGSNLRGLKPFLSAKLGIAVESLDDAVAAPDTALQVARSIREPLGPYGCAVGLAIEPEA
ncbi:MAG: pilus assembly protein PilM [Planctomycetes bacterium]|nr:pilus assembly protein PilM [Planctomycetota bacterium]